MDDEDYTLTIKVWWPSKTIRESQKAIKVLTQELNLLEKLQKILQTDLDMREATAGARIEVVDAQHV